MTPALALRRALCALVASSFALAGCDVMETQRVSLAPEPYETAGLRCESTLGSYALPKAFIHVRLEQVGSAPPELHTWGTAKAPVIVELHPDPTQLYCLDHLNSPTAADDVKILKYPGDKEKGQKNYLEWVLVNTTDQTAVIAQALIKAAFIVASGTPSASLREAVEPPRTILDLEYDPFDAAASAQVNRALTDKGFCLVLENYTAGSDLAHEKYCRDPGGYGARPTEFARVYKDYERRPADPKVAGIVYRPRQSYRLSIYRKFDPKGRGEEWRLQHMFPVELENLSPVFRLDLTRAIFAGKQAHFKFDRGALINSCISKASEIEGFVSIPLQVSKSLVDLPAQIFQVQINQVTQDRQLVQAQERVLLAQRGIIQAMVTGQYTSTGSASSAPVGPFAAKEIDLNAGNDAIEAQGLIAARPGPSFGAKPGECELEAAK